MHILIYQNHHTGHMVVKIAEQPCMSLPEHLCLEVLDWTVELNPARWWLCVSLYVELGKADDGETFDPSTLDPDRCESCYGAETEDLKYDTQTGSAFFFLCVFCTVLCLLIASALFVCVFSDAVTPAMTCGRRTGGEAGRSRAPTPSSSVRGKASRRRCRSRRTKAARFTASSRSTR